MAGTVVVRASPGTGDTLRLEAWYDSLRVRRSSRDGTLEPDADGLIGGRYRGRLAPAGAYVADARPFVPDGVAEVMDLSGAMEEFFPLLPERPLRAGERWENARSLAIERLSDSIAGDTLQRYRGSLAEARDAVTAAGDTGPIPAKQTTRSDEVFVWHHRLGLLRRDRTIVVETDIPRGETIRRPVRSRVEQRIVIERIRSFN